MKNSHLTLIVSLILALVVLGLTACGAQSTPSSSAEGVDLGEQTQQVPVEGGGSYTDVSAVGLAAMLDDKDFPLINVPFDEIEQNLDKLPADKDAQIVLYCRSGSMSGKAARELVSLGFTDVWNVDGGMIAWKQAGYPLLDTKQ
jgi:rhodanese-related sulfurtransferase